MRPTRQVRAVRGFLARLVAVLTVIAGLALLHTPQCTDGMTPVIDMTTAAEHVASDSGHTKAGSSMNASSIDTGGENRHLSDGTSVDDGMTGLPSGLHSGMLMTCLALLIIIVGLLAILRHPQMRVILRFTRTSVSTPRVPPPLPPSLIQLCILRT